MASLKDVLPPPTDGLILPKAQSQPQPAQLTVIPANLSPHAGVSRVLALPTTNHEPDYTAIVKQGDNATRTVHATHDALLQNPNAAPPLPSTRQIDDTARRTRAALDAVIAGKLAKGAASTSEKPAFVRYTPANTNTNHNSGSRQRVIKLVDAPADPMEPPRHAHKKAPVNPPSPPVPVLHSPERKLSKKEAADWKIPPVVSNWKNNRGYTISLDKRLAADGRGLIDHSINDRFAKFAEALYDAERTAREEVEVRARLQRQVTAKAKEARQRQLRELAERARRERKGYLGLDGDTSVAPSDYAPSEYTGAVSEREDAPRPVVDELPPQIGTSAGGAPEGDVSEIENVQRRDEIRAERTAQRERELRRREIRGEDGARPMLKRTKLTRDVDRDIGERAALGQDVTAAGRAEVLYDQRLFNQDGGASRRGTSLAGGYGADDAYSLYDRPLFRGSDSTAKFQYRGSGATDVDERERRFQADRGFAGTGRKDGDVVENGRREVRDRPVEFERDGELKSSANDDPYGLDKFLTEATKAKKNSDT